MALSVQERRKELSNLLKNEKLKNSELAERLHVSVSTIASDRKALREEEKDTDKQEHDTTEKHVDNVDNDIHDDIDKIIADAHDAVDDGIAKAQ